MPVRKRKLAGKAARRPVIHVVAPGRAAGSLARALRLAGWRVGTLWGRNRRRTERARRDIGGGTVGSLAHFAPPARGLLVLGAPDEVLAPLAEKLALHGGNWSGIVVVHLSGALTAEVLAPLAALGSGTASLHPLASLPHPVQGAAALAGAIFGVEGDPRGTAGARLAVAALGGTTLRVATEFKPLYHAAAVFAGNYPAAVLETARRLLRSAGVPEAQARAAAAQLATTCAAGFAARGLAALTGPLARGDRAVMAAHRRALAEDPRAALLYESLAAELAALLRSKISGR